MKLEEILDQLTHLFVLYAPRVAGAILVLVLGLWAIKGISGLISKIMQRRNVDPSLQPFLRGMVKNLLKVLLILSVMSMVGIEMTAFVAVIGALGLAVGLALSGTLQNFAGGVIILLFKPFKVGHFIEAQGFLGTVHEIQIFNTILKTPDNKTVIIPNGGLSTTSLTNFSIEEKRRIDWTFGIGYGDSIEEAEAVLRKLVAEDARILNEPAEPLIVVNELADSSVNFLVRVWVLSSDYWLTYCEMHGKVYNAFNAAGLNIPFPQMDVHVMKDA